MVEQENWGSKCRGQIRSICNDTIMAKFDPRVEVNPLLQFYSDHMPIMLGFLKCCKKKRKRPKLTRFEKMWLREQRCKEIVENIWGASTDQIDSKLA